MISAQLPLIFFTIFAQMGAGLLFVLLGLSMMQSGPGIAGSGNAYTALAASSLFVLSVISASWHLGNPIHAYHTIRNLKTSWLSREVLLTGIVTCLSILLTIAFFFFAGLLILLKTAIWITGIAAFLLIYSNARLYMIKSVPAWNKNRTLILFFSSTFILGAVGYVAINEIVNAFSPLAGLPETKYKILGGIVFFTGWLEICAFSTRAALKKDPGYLRIALDDFRAIRDKSLYYLRVVLSVGGIFSMLLFLYLDNCYWLYSAFLLSFFQELIGRILFFADYKRIGI